MPFLRRFAPGIAPSRPLNNVDINDGPLSASLSPDSVIDSSTLSPPPTIPSAVLSNPPITPLLASDKRALISASPLSPNSFCASSAASNSALVPAVFLESSKAFVTASTLAFARAVSFL